MNSENKKMGRGLGALQSPSNKEEKTIKFINNSEIGLVKTLHFL